MKGKIKMKTNGPFYIDEVVSGSFIIKRQWKDDSTKCSGFQLFKERGALHTKVYHDRIEAEKRLMEIRNTGE